MNSKKNKHYQQTDQKIKKAILDIIESDKNPTVAQICRIVNINRTTFYLHYEDIVELMEDLQNEIFQSFTDSYTKEKLDLTFMSYLSYKLFAQHVKENKKFYKYYFRVNTSFPLKDGYDYIYENIIIPYFHELHIVEEEIIKLRFVCFQAGFTITLKDWVEHDCHLSCDDVAKILCECIRL